MSILDPRREEIAALHEAISSYKEQIHYLREQLAEKDRINVALTNSHAARFLYPSHDSQPPPTPYSAESSPDPAIKRLVEAPTPEFSLKQLEQKLKLSPSTHD